MKVLIKRYLCYIFEKFIREKMNSILINNVESKLLFFQERVFDIFLCFVYFNNCIKLIWIVNGNVQCVSYMFDYVWERYS